MRDFSWRNLERWLVLLIGVLPLVSKGNRDAYHTCPQDPEASTRECLYSYNALLSSLSIENLYTGVDTEYLRHICSSLMTSVICAHNLKKACPDTEHTDISMVLEDIVSMYELCSVKDIFEVYSRNQNCFLRQSASSEECYNKFLVATEEYIMTRALTGDETAIAQLCIHVDALIACVKTRVLFNCNQEAANMVEWLVKPSIKMSEHCRNETLYKSSTTTTPELSVTATVKHHGQRWVPSSSVLNRLTWPTFLMTSLLVLIT